MSGVPAGVAPAAPTWSSGRATPDGSATLTWQPEEHATSYRLRHRLARPGAAWVSDPVPAGATTAVVGGLRGGQRYVVRVRGLDGRVAGAWSAQLEVAVPVVGPVRDVVARLPEGGRLLRTAGGDVRWATGYRVLLATTRACGSPPGPARFEVVARVAAPRHAVPLGRGSGAVWVRWRAEHDGVPGRVVASSTACVPR